MKNFEIRIVLSKLRFLSNKLAVITGKLYKIKKENRLSNFCNVNALEDELHFLIDCPNHKKLRESALKSIQDILIRISRIQDIHWTYWSKSGKYNKEIKRTVLKWIASIVICIRKICPDCNGVKRKLPDLSLYQPHFEEENHNPDNFYLFWFIYFFYLLALSCCRFFFF